MSLLKFILNFSKFAKQFFLFHKLNGAISTLSLTLVLKRRNLCSTEDYTISLQFVCHRLKIFYRFPSIISSVHAASTLPGLLTKPTSCSLSVVLGKFSSCLFFLGRFRSVCFFRLIKLSLNFCPETRESLMPNPIFV